MREHNYKLFKHQMALMTSKSPITYMVCGRAAGKSFAASLLIVKYLLEGKNVIALAQTYKSLSEVLFAEIRNRLEELGVNAHINMGSMKITYGEGTIYGASYENLESIRGLSRISLAVCDEAALSPNKLFTVLSPCLRGEGIEGRIRLLSTPRRGSWLNLFCKEHPENIELIHATTRDNKFITEDQIKMMTSSIINEDLIAQEIEGVMLDIDSDASIIQLKDYPRILHPYGVAKGPYMGIDLAGLGTDSNVITVVNEFEILEQESIKQADTFQMTRITEDLYSKHNAKGIMIDVTGSTSCGVKDVLVLKKYPVAGINFAQAAYDKDRYINARCEMYVELANAIKSGMYIHDDEIKTQLAFTTIFVNHSGRFQLNKKEEIKELIGHSPDKADSLALAVYAMNHTDQTPEYNSKKAEEIGSKYLTWVTYGD